MKYVGNYKDWIKDEYIDYILNNDGTCRPGGGRNPDTEEFRVATKAGYDLSRTLWHIYEKDTFPFNIEMPFMEGECLWWGIKMTPGQYMPMHRDPHTYDVPTTHCRRFWMSFADYEPGHIFMHDNQVLTDYKKGDVFEYTDSQLLHGACNIGYTPRITFHFSTFTNL